MIISVVFLTCIANLVDTSIPHTLQIFNKSFVFYDVEGSNPKYMETDFEKDVYKLQKIKFKRGDVVFDIGGNIGAFAIPLAKKYPFLKIYSFEPAQVNYENFKKNMLINNVPDGVITLVRRAVTKDENDTVKMMKRPLHSSGGVVVSGLEWDDSFRSLEDTAETITLAGIFKKFNIKKCRLMKMDCEGCEYETLYGAPDEVFQRTEYFRGEFHLVKKWRKKGMTPEKIRLDTKRKFGRYQYRYHVQLNYNGVEVRAAEIEGIVRRNKKRKQIPRKKKTDRKKVDEIEQ